MSSPNPSLPSTSLSRIQDLNQIDSTIPQLLRAAGTAIQLLGSPNPNSTTTTTTTLPSTKAQFLTSITTYFTLLSSIDVRLRRQVYALQEAGLIAEGDAKDAKRGASTAAAAASAAVAGGGGQLDLSWLNSRGDQVEKDMEREVWGRAREFVESLLQAQSNGHAKVGTGDAEMMMEGGESTG